MRLKVALIINTIGSHGPGKVVYGILNNMDLKKNDVMLVTLMAGNDKDMIKALSKKGIKIIEFNCKNKLDFLFHLKSIKKTIKELDFDVINSHGIMPDDICIGAGKKTKKVATLHNNLFEDYKMSFNPLVAKYAIKKNLKYYDKMDQNICCSKSIYDVLKNRIKNVSYITNGADVVTYKNSNVIKNELGLPSDSIVYLFAGKIESIKNVPKLIELFKKNRNKNEYLLVAGEGSEENLCIDAIGDDTNIRMIGFKDDIGAYMSIADAYTSNSISEGMPISCLEALGYGDILLLSDIDSHKALFAEAGNAYIGELFNDDNFSECIKTIRKHIGDRKKRVATHKKFFSSKVMSSKYQRAYLKIVEGNYEKA